MRARQSPRPKDYYTDLFTSINLENPFYEKMTIAKPISRWSCVKIM